MSQPSFSIDVHDHAQASQARAGTAVGQRFAFLSGERQVRPVGRLARLMGLGRGSDATRRVIPLLSEPVSLPGMSLTPEPLDLQPLFALITDRDLYRAEQDTVNVFLAMPAPSAGMRLIVENAGQIFSERPLELEQLDVLREHGLHLEPLAMLLPGDYSVQLAIGNQRLGRPATFTVAEYTLAPLSGRLRAHSLDRTSQQLSFSLEVDSYQQPYDRALRVELIEAGVALASVELQPVARGRYEGQLPVSGEGLLRLRLSACDDAERVCEVVVPGSRRSERDTTVLSALGTERLISLMPEPGALPLRGAWLSDGDFLATPVVVEQIIATEGVLSVRSELEALTTITVDLTTGEAQVQEHGTVAAGAEVRLALPSCAATVFVGGWSQGAPFEGFTHFLRPASLDLGVSAAHDPQQGTLRVSVRGVAPGRPVLVSVRDERLTQADTPAVALSGALKRTVEAATEGHRSGRGLIQLSDEQIWRELQPVLPVPALPFPSTLDFMESEPVRSPQPLYSAEVGDVVRSAFSGAPAPVEGTTGAMPDRFELDEPDGALYDDEVESEPPALSEAIAPQSAVPVLGKAISAEQPPTLPAGVRARGTGPGPVEAEVTEQAEDTEQAPAPADTAPPRATFPEILFYDLVQADDAAELEIPVADVLGTFTVEVFCVDRSDWAHQRATVIVDQPVRADLVVPPAVHDGDQVTGTFRGAATGGSVRLSLTCDGQPVPLRDPQGAAIAADAILPSPAEVRFDVRSGVYLATTTDVASGASDTLQRIVSVPGEIRSYVRELGLLVAGDRLDLHQAGDEVLSLRVLPGLDEPLGCLVEATASYAHLCCEQTAAKILSATAMYLSARGPGVRSQAEQIIVAGVAREAKMHLPGRGFKMYPDMGDYVSEHYSKLAVRYLWKLHQLSGLPSLSPALRSAIERGLAMADDAGRFHQLQRVPETIASPEDAYTLATEGRREAAAAWLEQALDLSAGEPCLRTPQHAVHDRVTLSYAAAALLALGEVTTGLRTANVVTRQLNAEGRLYSTVDSVAAIALMVQLQRSGISDQGGVVLVNGEQMSTTEAAERSDQIETLSVHSGVCLVELLAIHTERWDRFVGGPPMRIGFRDPQGERQSRFAQGDRTTMRIELTDGYEAGDLLHVCLPAALSWLKGGGKVQQFTVDFEGQDTLEVPVLVTGEVAGTQRFAVCMRNMFEEERASNPGILSIQGR